MITDIDVSGCKEACEQETQFKCVSIEYHREDLYCLLKKEDRHSRVLIEKRWFNYYDLNCTGTYLKIL